MAVTREACKLSVVKVASPNRSWTLAAVLVLLQPVATYALSLEEVIRAHESAIDLIHSVDLHLVTERRPKSNPSARPETIYDMHWLEDRIGGRRRLRRQGLALPESSLGRFIDGVADANGDYRILRGWNSERPPDIGPGVPTRVVSEEGRFDAARSGELVGVAAPLVWLVDAAPPTTLAEAVAERPGSELLPEKQEVDGAECSVIEMPHSDSGLGSKLRVFVDPDLNFAMRKIETVTKPFVVAGREEPMVVSVTTTVKKHRDFGNGIFIPTEVESIASDSPYILTNRVLSVKVNQPFDPDAFELVIPKWVRVLDTARNVVGLADGEGGRMVTWDSTDEETQWWLENYPATGAIGNSANTRWFLVAINVVIVLILVVAVILRRRVATKLRSLWNRALGEYPAE